MAEMNSEAVIDPVIWAKRLQAFCAEAHAILSTSESAKSRVILLDKTYKTIGNLGIRQDDLFRQALRCLECELYRAAHVMAWAAFADFIQELISLNLSNISAIRKTWDCTSLDIVVEKYPESQLIDALADAKVFTKNERKALQGLLSKRNECAHPSEYFPGLNETLGYISGLLLRLETVKKRCKI